MSSAQRPAFEAFVCTHCAELLRELGGALQVPLAILGRDGATLCASDGAAGLARAGARLAAPIVCHGEELAILATESRRPELQSLLLTLSEELADRFRTESDLDRMTDQLAQSYDEINLLYSFARLLRPDRSYAANARLLLRETAELLESRLLVLCHRDPPLTAWNAGPGLALEQSQRWVVTHPDRLHAIHGEIAARLPSSPTNERRRLSGVVDTPHGAVHYLAAPEHVAEEVCGYVGILRTESEGQIETGELRLVESLAEELGNAATAKKLDRALREMVFHTVRSLVAAIDAKDEYTRGHSERVTMIADRIGACLGLPPAQRRTLYWAALLHDVGKIAVRGDILNKPARLTEEEFAVIRSHPARGCAVLEHVPELRDALPAIRHHHERYDGGGYPDGLRGEAIPLFARVISVADAYDAITSTRAYRSAHSPEYGLEELIAGAGTQFDPGIVALFRRLAAEGPLFTEALEPLPQEDEAGADAADAAPGDERAA